MTYLTVYMVCDDEDESVEVCFSTLTLARHYLNGLLDGEGICSPYIMEIPVDAPREKWVRLEQ